MTLAAIFTRRVTLPSSGDWRIKPATLWRTPATAHKHTYHSNGYLPVKTEWLFFPSVRYCNNEEIFFTLYLIFFCCLCSSDIIFCLYFWHPIPFILSFLTISCFSHHNIPSYAVFSYILLVYLSLFLRKYRWANDHGATHVPATYVFCSFHLI